MKELKFIDQNTIKNKLTEDPNTEFIVNCIIENDAVEFLNFLATEFNISFCENNFWERYKENTCYKIEYKQLEYCFLDYYSSNYKHLTNLSIQKRYSRKF